MAETNPPRSLHSAPLHHGRTNRGGTAADSPSPGGEGRGEGGISLPPAHPTNDRVRPAWTPGKGCAASAPVAAHGPTAAAAAPSPGGEGRGEGGPIQTRFR